MKPILACILLAAACAPRSDVTFSSSAASTPLTASGSLGCVPAAAQTAACAGKAVGDGCTETKADGGRFLAAGLCRATVDGTGIACTPEPPPRREAVDACTGKAAGDVCQPDRLFHAGLCAEVGTTLACMPVADPGPLAVAACAALDAGDGCTLPFHRDPREAADAGVFNGFCATSTGITADAGTTTVVACRPVSREVKACAGLAAGAACALGNAAGFCQAPASGDDITCVVPCAAFFRDGFCGGFDCQGGY